MRRLKRPQELRNDIGGKRATRGYGQLSRRPACDLGDRSSGFLGALEQGLGAGKQHLARCAQLDRPAQPIEQKRPQLALQSRDLPGHRRLRQVQRPRGLSETSQLRHRDKRFELA
jgi:hypothetical protein